MVSTGINPAYTFGSKHRRVHIVTAGDDYTYGPALCGITAERFSADLDSMEATPGFFGICENCASVNVDWKA